MIVVAALFAASGLLFGWAIGSAVASHHVKRRREHESMKNHQNLCRAIARTARTKSGEQ